MNILDKIDAILEGRKLSNRHSKLMKEGISSAKIVARNGEETILKTNNGKNIMFWIGLDGLDPKDSEGYNLVCQMVYKAPDDEEDWEIWDQYNPMSKKDALAQIDNFLYCIKRYMSKKGIKRLSSLYIGTSNQDVAYDIAHSTKMKSFCKQQGLIGKPFTGDHNEGYWITR